MLISVFNEEGQHHYPHIHVRNYEGRSLLSIGVGGAQGWDMKKTQNDRGGVSV